MNSSVFNTYLDLGFHHIFNRHAYDHLAFLVALSAVYSFKDWRRVILLATAFTIGHSVTLALSVLDIIPVNETLIEALIPVTILFTSLANFRKQPLPTNPGFRIISAKNMLAAGFGLIHGMGFSNYLRQLLPKGENPVMELFSFNIGLEIGQVWIVLLSLALNSFAVRFMRQSDWAKVLSGITALISGYILFGILY